MTEPNKEPEITIPYVDIRNGTPVDLLNGHHDKMVDLVKASGNSFGWVSKVLSAMALPAGDFFSRRWLKKTDNPYLAEIEAYEKAGKIRGIVALNVCYEWGCTTGAYTQDNSTSLVRVLDWPFPRLGENIVVAHQKGEAGEFHNVTWPGVSGVFNAVAKGRFAAALNQAPMRRHRLSFIVDWAKNRHLVNKQNALPPAHLLRKAFETSATYEEAKKLLSTEPVSIPVIYTLTGVNPGEGCVIERLENKAVVREMKNGKVFAANHFVSDEIVNSNKGGWMSRGNDSGGRAECALTMPSLDDDFAWFKEPITNERSRLVMVGDAASGRFQVMGTAGAKRVTKVFRI